MIDSRSPLLPPKLVQPRQPGLLYHVEHMDNQLYILAITGPGQEYEVNTIFPLSHTHILFLLI